MYIPSTFFSTQGSCITATTTAISGSGGVSTGTFISGGFYWDYWKFENTIDVNTGVSSSFTASFNILSGSTSQAKILIVAGGGGGGYNPGDSCINPYIDTLGSAGGGGGGGVVYYNQFQLSSGSYEVVVGAGGQGGGATRIGQTGGRSYFKNKDFDYTPFTSSFLVAYGGGGGAGCTNNCIGAGIGIGASGASSGGGAQTGIASTVVPEVQPLGVFGGVPEVIQGNRSGGITGNPYGNDRAMGGGGAGTSSADITSTYNPSAGSPGGSGIEYNLTGTALKYGAGGSGVRWANTGTGTLTGDGAGWGNPGSGGYGGFGARFTIPRGATPGLNGVVIIAIPRCTSAFDCKTFAISGSGQQINYLECTTYGFVTSSTTIPLYDVFTTCLTTLSGSNTPLVLDGNYQSATLIGSCDLPFSSSTPSDWPLPYDTCSCLSYKFTAGPSGGTATNILYCGSAAASSSISMSAGQSLDLCLNSSSVAAAGITGAGSTKTFNGYCTTGSCAALTDLFVEYLAVGGGGAGGGYSGAGGGAGGYISGQYFASFSQSYNVVVGAGGTAAGLIGTNGGNSSIFGVTAIGGGAGAVGINDALYMTGSNGGSGGGGAYITTPNTNGNGGSGTSLQGNNGGAGYAVGRDSGGGGGANETGFAGSSTSNGGAGKAWIDGVYYAGGGGGWRQVSALESSNGLGGSGGGGIGGQNTNVGAYLRNPTSGSPNTGGGGGGAYQGISSSGSWDGGSGIVKLRYFATASLATGGTITQSGSFIYHTFTGSGTFTTL